ncbi:hypothetical protein Taro_031191 [Colocasia esculenta]|uniref:Uncharacterized protein n=1 Tax=Colocasia esculenta TaxID=4460 RepID=A0A843VR69_COLES|nr:hypothetical protein [Colocasia esculenta]
MVAGFRRFASLPVPGPARGPSPPEKSYHVRSTSLPCRSHLLISQLEDEVRATGAWRLPSAPAPDGLRSGLVRLELLHLALDDLLQLPQTRDSLRRGPSGLADSLLDDFLRFADAYGSFRSALVALRDLQEATQVAARRGDAAGLSSAARLLRKAEKEVAALASALPEVPRSVEAALTATAASSGGPAADAELAGFLREVKAVTVSVSAAVFQGTAAALSSAAAAVASRPSSSSWKALRRLTSSPSLKNKTEEEEQGRRRASERLAALEGCLAGMEEESERVFRGNRTPQGEPDAGGGTGRRRGEVEPDAVGGRGNRTPQGGGGTGRRRGRVDH